MFDLMTASCLNIMCNHDVYLIARFSRSIRLRFITK